MNEDSNVVTKLKETGTNAGLDAAGKGSIIEYLLHSDRVPASADMVPHNLGCTFQCGLPVKDDILVSESMFRSSNLFEPVLKNRKDVMDYCFLTDHTFSNSEIVCNFGTFHCVQREDIESLLPNTKIEAVVIEAWAILLNKFQIAQKGNDKLTRIFYGIAHSGDIEKILKFDEDNIDELAKLKQTVYNTWDMWSALFKEPLNLNSDMVFIPLVYEEHYVCICVDLKRQKMLYLDNREYDEFQDEEHVHMAHMAATLYGDYLNTKGIESGIKVKDYEMNNVKFHWQSKELNLDCGLFMMFHMMFFVGEPFDCELSDANMRQLYRGEVAATLVLSDLNKDRSQVWKRVTTFTATKGILLTKLLAKRQGGRKQSKREKGGKNKVQTPLSKIKATGEDGSASVVGSGKRGKSDGLGCTLNCGVADPKFEFVSRFMKLNKSLCANMLTTRKEVIDYCLLEDPAIKSKSEVVAKFSDDQYLARQDILSLLPTVHVNNNVIECWSLILNHIEHTEPCETSLLFFGIRHMESIIDVTKGEEAKREKIFEEWDKFIRRNTVPCNMEADLVFIPMVLQEHYFCVCVNFKTETIEVLDNTEYDNWEQTEIYKVADSVAYHMSDFLAWKNVDRAHNVIDFDVVNTSFNWQKKEANNIESGNFLMMHMIRYEGQLFEADLQSKVQRRYYWLEIAAALLLADINNMRTALIGKVKEFTAGKGELLNRLKEMRKNKEDAKGKGNKIKAKDNDVEKDNTVEQEITKAEGPPKEKPNVQTKAKEDATRMPTINTEIPILRKSPIKRLPESKQDGEDDAEKPPIQYKRLKTTANPNNRGRGRGRGRGQK